MEGSVSMLLVIATGYIAQPTKINIDKKIHICIQTEQVGVVVKR
jgi:hypothetical protein